MSWPCSNPEEALNWAHSRRNSSKRSLETCDASLGCGSVGGLALLVNLRHLEMVPNDSPYPKTWGLTPKTSLWYAYKLSYSMK